MGPACEADTIIGELCPTLANSGRPIPDDAIVGSHNWTQTTARSGATRQ
jgi:hypothetical protein